MNKEQKSFILGAVGGISAFICSICTGKAIKDLIKNYKSLH